MEDQDISSFLLRETVLPMVRDTSRQKRKRQAEEILLG